MIPTYPAAASTYQQGQENLALRIRLAARVLWGQVAVSDLDASWRAVSGQVLALVAAGQLVAAEAADPYVAAVVAELGLRGDQTGSVVPDQLTGVASDGRDLSTLLDQPLIDAKTQIGEGATPAQATASAGSRLEMLAQTMVQDAGRLAVGMAIAARPRVTGYIRMLTPPSCSRCVVLAGQFYRWSSGFQRHPRCDCRHVPASEDVAGDLRTDPNAYFGSLSAAEQDKAFTKAGAQAIRDGADLSQVVNARRGAIGLTPAGARITAAEAKILRQGLDRGRLAPVELYGRQVYVTTEGMTKRGAAYKAVGPGRARLMPETIYQIAEDRADAVRLLKRYGYLAG